MKRKALAILMLVCLVASLLAMPVSALPQDPVMLVIKTVAYGEGQNTLIAEGYFVNTSNKAVTSVMDAQLEILQGGTTVAYDSFDIISVRTVSVGIGDGEPWRFVMKNPVKGLNLANWTANSKLTYNVGKAEELETGKKIYYNGGIVRFDVPPTIINGRLMIPARAVFENMGCTIAWNAESRSVEVQRGSTVVTLFIDNPIMTVSGTAVKLDSPATIVNGRTLVPLRAIANAMGAGVTYGELNEMAVIFE